MDDVLPNGGLRFPDALSATRDAISDALAALPGRVDPVVFAMDHDVGDAWHAVEAELTEAFAATRNAMRLGRSVVYIVPADDLLGRRGPGPAMVACGLLSGARVAALEGLKQGVTCNVLAIAEGTPPRATAAWVLHLANPAAGGTTGEVVRLDPGHLGKALP